MTGLAAVLGPVLGGAVTQGLGWQWIFWLNVPIALGAIALALARVAEATGPGGTLDLTGLALAAVGALGLTWGLVRGNTVGWASAETAIAFAAGAVATAGFVAWERRAAAPMLPVRLFRSPSFSAGNAAIFLLNASLTGAVFLMPQFEQVVDGASPLGAGLRLLPWGIAPVLLAPRAGALADRIGERVLAVTGLLLQAAGLAWIAAVAAPGAGRLGYRAVMALGLILLGVPAAALATSPALPLLLVASLARGAGLGIVVVAGTALAAGAVPAERRGEGLGVYGVAVGVPAVACLPLGVWLSGHVGYPPVFLAGAALPLAGLLATVGLPAQRAGVQRHHAVLSGLRVPGLARPAMVFAAVTLAVGVLVTFLPLAMPGSSRQVAAVALLALTGLTPVARRAAGRYGDRHGSSGLLVPAVLAAALGTAALVRVDSPVAVIAGMALFGAGFGAAQNVTLAVMFERVPQSEFGRVSALWNLAYDGGMGIGAVGFGLLVGWTGYAAAFGLTAAILAAALIPARQDDAVRRA